MPLLMLARIYFLGTFASEGGEFDPILLAVLANPDHMVRGRFFGKAQRTCVINIFIDLRDLEVCNASSHLDGSTSLFFLIYHLRVKSGCFLVDFSETSICGRSFRKPFGCRPGSGIPLHNEWLQTLIGRVYDVDGLLPDLPQS